MSLTDESLLLSQELEANPFEMIAESPTPPKKRRQRRPRPIVSQEVPTSGNEKSGKRTSKIERLTAMVAGFYGMVGMAVMNRDLYDGAIIIKTAEDRAKEVLEVAKLHPWLMKFLEKAEKGNAYGSLILGHGMVLYAIMAHHDRLPKSPLLATYGYSEEQLGLPTEQVQPTLPNEQYSVPSL